MFPFLSSFQPQCSLVVFVGDLGTGSVFRTVFAPVSGVVRHVCASATRPRHLPVLHQAYAAAVQEQLLAMAMSRAKALMSEHEHTVLDPMGHKADLQQHGVPVTRKRALSLMSLEVEDCSIRGAFSHIPLWQSLMADVQLVGQHMSGGDGLFPLARHKLTAAQIKHIKAIPPADSEWYFRRTIQVNYPRLCQAMFAQPLLWQ